MLTRTHAWSRTQKVLIVSATATLIGRFVAFAYSYQRSHHLPDESILFGSWQMTAPHDTNGSTILSLDEFGEGLYSEDMPSSPLHVGTWIRYGTAKQVEDCSNMSWYAGGSYIYMFLVDERPPQIWEILDVGPEELRLRHAKQDYVFRRLPN